MRDELERAPSKRARGEAGVPPERRTRLDRCRHCDSRFPTRNPRDRQLRFKQAHLHLVR